MAVIPPNLGHDLPKDDAVEIVSLSDIGPHFFESFDGSVIHEEAVSSQHLERPVPYLVDYTSKGEVTIGWNQPMQ